MMINNHQVKEMACTLGADICGVAPIARFHDAPQGFHPADVFPAVQSVIMFAKKMPEGALHGSSGIPYTVVSHALRDETVRIGWMLAAALERTGHMQAMPLPGDPYAYWDPDNLTGKGLISFRHAGMLAGLGSLGKNTLLNTPQYGNRITLGAVLADAYIEGDPLLADSVCGKDCAVCLQACPVGAIGDGTVDQKKCRPYSQTETPRGDAVYSCNVCRKICPHGAGVQPAV